MHGKRSKDSAKSKPVWKVRKNPVFARKLVKNLGKRYVFRGFLPWTAFLSTKHGGENRICPAPCRQSNLTLTRLRVERHSLLILPMATHRFYPCQSLALNICLCLCRRDDRFAYIVSDNISLLPLSGLIEKAATASVAGCASPPRYFVFPNAKP